MRTDGHIAFNEVRRRSSFGDDADQSVSSDPHIRPLRLHLLTFPLPLHSTSPSLHRRRVVILAPADPRAASLHPGLTHLP